MSQKGFRNIQQQGQQRMQVVRQQSHQGYQRMQESWEHYTSNQEIVAAAACGLGAVIVIMLSLIGGAADVEWLQRSGFNFLTIFFYILVAACGFAIWKGVRFGAMMALGLIGIDFLVDIIVQYATHGDFPNWLIFLKFPIIFLAVGQVIFNADDDDDDDEYYEDEYPPQQGGYPPQQGGWQ